MKTILQLVVTCIFLLIVLPNAAQEIQLIKDIDPNGSGYPQNLKVINDKLFFSASDGTN